MRGTQLSPLALVIVTCTTHLDQPCADEPFRYAFRAGETNVYRVQIELTAEGGVVRYDGHVFLTAKRVEAETGQAALALRGSLAAHADTTATPMPYRPPVLARSLGFPPYAEIEVDRSGRLLAEVVDVPLPLQAGRLGAFLVLPLPPDPDGPVESHAEVNVPDETPRPGVPWYPPYHEAPMFGRSTMASFKADRTTRVEAGTVTPESAESKWTWELRSRRQFEGAPGFDASGEGQALLDRVNGVLRKVRFNYRETSASDTVTRRSRLTFEARLLEGDERLAALNRVAPRTPQTLTAADVRAALDDLKSKDDQRRSDAIQRLQSDPLDPLPEEIAARAESLLDSRDDSIRWAVARVVAEGATTNQVPTLLRLIKEPESPVRQPALQALGRLKDPRAIAALVEFVARGESERYAATEALKQFGPEAEEAVLQLFREMNLETRRAACQILQNVGTARSLDTLREAMLDPDRQLRDLASQAVGAIVGRGR